jgi:hypothetical protein
MTPVKNHRIKFFKTTIALNAVTLGLLVFCVLLFALNAGKGFDITDRSFYLLWAGQPENVTGAFHHFGFITGFIYGLAGNSIVAFRLSGLLILLVVGIIFAHSFKRYLDEKYLSTNSDFLTFGLIFTIGILFGYNGWFHSPSYNWLAVVSSVMVISGLLYFTVTANDIILTSISTIMVATGGVLAHVAKPTTALALGVISVLWVATEGVNKRSLTFIFSAATLAGLFLLLFIYVFFGSISQYFDNLKLGMELAGLLDAGHDLSETFNKPVNQTFTFFKWWLKLPFVWFFIAITAVGLVIIYYKAKFRPYFSSFLAFITFFAFCVFTYLFYESHRNVYASTTLISVIGCGFIAYIAFILVEELSPGEIKIKRGLLIKGFLAAFLFFLAAFAPSFGTGNSQILPHISRSAIFLAGSLLIFINLISPQNNKKMIFGVFGLIFSVLLTIFLVKAYEQPYRLVGSISNQTVHVDFIDPAHKVYVDPITAQYVKDLKFAANKAGWQRGTPLIDMTGGSPGALVVLDARIVGTPWLLGAYEGSNAFAKAALKSVDQKILNKAWVLTAPEGRRRIDIDVLHKHGLNFPDQYEKVGKLKTGHRNEEQFLWKPTS